MSQELLISFEKGARLIQLNRPKTRNAFNNNFYDTIARTLQQDAKDSRVVVTIITGLGDYYSSGFDIKSAGDNDQETNMRVLKDMIEAFIDYPKLLIALINGPAIGVAVTTAALCDVVYASDRATFETPFVRIGLCAEGCSSYTFPRLLGRSKASELLLMGKRMTAQEAYDFGFVAKVIPHKSLPKFLEELKNLGCLSVRSVQVTKQLIMRNYRDKLYTVNDEELKQLEECFANEEFSEAMVRFMTRKSKL